MPKAWTRWHWLAALTGLAIGLVATGILLRTLFGSGTGSSYGALHLADYEVYRGAVRSWLAGNGLYDTVYPTGETGPMLPFTYPPFAALVMAPIGVIPATAAAWIWVLLSLALCPVLAVLLLRQAPGAGRTLRPTSLVAGGLVALGLLLSEPVTHNLFVGQLSVFVVFLAFVDAGGYLPARWRGFGVGIAGAIKLIPLVFIGYYLVTRQWRAAVQAAAGFLAATLLGFLVLPAESVRYWTVLVFDTSRVGDIWLSRNKSLLGLLTRWGLGDARWLWLLLAAAVAAAALWRARQHHLRGEEVAAALVVGSLSIVLTPISWPHHQIWVPLVALYLILLRRWWPAFAGALLLAGYSFATPLIVWQETGSLWLRLLWEVPTLVAVAISILGLPRRSPDQADPSAAADLTAPPVAATS